jgi:hypothetical protein
MRGLDPRIPLPRQRDGRIESGHDDRGKIVMRGPEPRILPLANEMAGSSPAMTIAAKSSCAGLTRASAAFVGMGRPQALAARTAKCCS